VLRGVGKLEADDAHMRAELDAHWEVLGEAVQTVMRRYGIEKPYEKLKELTRGRDVTAETMRAFIEKLAIPEDARKRLLAMTPSRYTGDAEAQAASI
jgi:adenylosuccinate lyase